MKIIPCEQGTPEWYQARLGKVTASRIGDMMARTKTGWGASRYNYEAELIVERLTKVHVDGYKSAAMQWGHDTEPQARAAYEFFRDCTIEPIGFIEHDSLEAGASPDGFVGKHGLVEFKCPLTATHVDTLLNGTFPGKYILQAQWQMFIAGRQMCDLVSYDPRMPQRMRMFVQPVMRDEAVINGLVGETVSFLRGIKEKIEELEKKYGAA